jgi:hypothetical protein
VEKRCKEALKRNSESYLGSLTRTKQPVL